MVNQSQSELRQSVTRVLGYTEIETIIARVTGNRELHVMELVNGEPFIARMNQVHEYPNLN